MFQKTKKFFKRSIQTVKSYFSESYQKLPKTPSYDDNHSTGFSLESIYTEFVDQWEDADHIMGTAWEKNTNNLKNNKPSMLIDHHEVSKRKQQKHEEMSSREQEEKRRLMTRRLKEFEFMDKDNVDHVRDIQQIMHYYSRLTCPPYCEMVEKFLTEMYLEVFNPKRTPIRV